MYIAAAPEEKLVNKKCRKKFILEKLKSQFHMTMELVEHFSGNGGDHDTSSVRIWRQSKWNQTF